MFRKLALHGSMIAILFLAVFTALADDRYSAEGSGEFREGDDRTRLTDATFELRDNDHFTLTLRGHHDKRYELRGTCKGGGRHRDLTIKKGLDKDDLNGWGSIELADNSGKIKSLNISGSFKNGKQYSADFSRERQAYSDRENFDDFSLSDSVSGSGRIERFGRSKDIDRIQVRMSSNGDLNIRVDGFDVSRLSWDGRWSGDGSTRDIELRHSSNNSRIRADGKITLSGSRKSVRELDIRGTEDGEDFRIRFTADSFGGSGGSHNHNDSDFNDNDRFSLTDTLSGSGRLKIGEDDHEITNIRVHMSSNHDLHITVEGSDFNDMDLEGTWSGSGMEYAVSINKSSASNTHGTGTLMLSSNNRHVRSFEMSGKAYGLNMHLNFSAE